MRKNEMIECVRGIACLFVVLVHYPLPGTVGKYVIAYARFAVPFFIMVSGYFSYKGDKIKECSLALKRLKSTAMLTLYGTLLYFVCNTFNYILRGREPFSWFFNSATWVTLRRFILFNRAVILSSVMYYLFMMIYVYIIYWLLAKTDCIRKAYYFIAPLLIANLVINEFLGLNWYYAGNAFLTGIPFFLLGHMINDKKILLSDGAELKLIVAGIIINLIEYRFFGVVYLYLGTIFTVTGLFFLCIKNFQRSCPKLLVKFGTYYSTPIFLLHIAVGKILSTLFEKLNINAEPIISVTVIVTTVGIISVYYFISSKIRRVPPKTKSVREG